MDLLAAAAQGDTHTITSILDSKSVNVDFQNTVNGWTALHWACKRNHISTVKLLLAHGAQILCNFKNQTPLDVAQDPQSMQFILQGSNGSSELNSSDILNNSNKSDGTRNSDELLETVVKELSSSSLEMIFSKFKIDSIQDLLIKLRN